jgi:hypothetical protein
MPGEMSRAEDSVMEMAGVDVLLDPAFTVPAVPAAPTGHRKRTPPRWR